VSGNYCVADFMQSENNVTIITSIVILVGNNFTIGNGA